MVLNRRDFNRTSAAVFATLAILGSLLSSTAAGQDVVRCNGEVATIVGTAGADVLRGTSGRDVIAGLSGADIISGLGGNDVICGGFGDDILRGNAGADEILGGFGNDRIIGNAGADVLLGGADNDVIFAAGGAALEAREATIGSTLNGGNGNDVLYGSDRADRLIGGNGDDTIFGYQAGDLLRGNAGADRLVGGVGADDIDGGAGPDSLSLTSGDIARGGLGIDACSIQSGEPALISSCLLDEGEAPAAPAQPSASSFSFTHFSGARWNGEFLGFVEAEVSDFVDDPGRCFLVLAEITPETLVEGSVLSTGFRAPSFGVIARGEFIGDDTRCETNEADLLGYEWILNAEATLGTTIPVYSEIFIPSTNAAAISSIIVGDPRFGGDFLEIDPVELDEIPAPASTNLRVGQRPVGIALNGQNGFSYTHFNDAEWLGRLLDVVPAPVNRFVDEPGRCFLVLGEITPTQIDGLVSSGFDTPPIGGLADGRHIEDGARCDTSEAEADGFGWILDAEVTLGTAYEFYAEIFVPDSNSGSLDQIVVGNISNDVTVFNVQG